MPIVAVGRAVSATALQARRDCGVPFLRQSPRFSTYPDVRVGSWSAKAPDAGAGFRPEDVRSLLDVLERLPEAGGPLPETDEEAHEEWVATLRKYWMEADVRCDDLRREPASAEKFARSPHGPPAQLLDAPTSAAKRVRR